MLYHLYGIFNRPTVCPDFDCDSCYSCADFDYYYNNHGPKADCVDLYKMLTLTMHDNMIPEIFLKDLQSSVHCDKYMINYNLQKTRDNYFNDLRIRLPDIHNKITVFTPLTFQERVYLAYHFAPFKSQLKKDINITLFNNIGPWEYLKFKLFYS